MIPQFYLQVIKTFSWIVHIGFWCPSINFSINKDKSCNPSHSLLSELISLIWFRTYPGYTFLVEKVELSTLLRCRTTPSLHRSFGPPHVICFRSQKWLLRKLPLEKWISIGRILFMNQEKREEYSFEMVAAALLLVGWWPFLWCPPLFCFMDARNAETERGKPKRTQVGVESILTRFRI